MYNSSQTGLCQRFVHPAPSIVSDTSLLKKQREMSVKRAKVFWMRQPDTRLVMAFPLLLS